MSFNENNITWVTINNKNQAKCSNALSEKSLGQLIKSPLKYHMGMVTIKNEKKAK